MSNEKIAIIGGAGDLGFGLALRWAKAGIEVVIGSRDAAKAVEAATKVKEIAGGKVSGVENAMAADGATVVVLAVPFTAQAAILKSIKDSLKNCIVVDTTVPLAAAVGGKPTRLLSVWEGSAAEAAREIVPKNIPVLAAFHNVSASVLQDMDHAAECDILVCGDDKEAKEKLLTLIETIEDLRPLDAGPLEMARLVEGITPLLISLNRRYKTHSGIRITGV
jgi:NADPH-dependent F420 reductase